MAAVEVDRHEFRQAEPKQRRRLREYARQLESEPYLGDRVHRVPTEFRGLPNLFLLKLPDGWRALYTVVGSATRGISVKIVWIGDHARYDRLFGY